MIDKHKLEFYLLKLIGSLLSNLGNKVLIPFSSILSFLFFNVLRIRRKIVLKNLKIAFPNYSDQQIKRIAINNYKSFAITFLEIFNLQKLSKDELKSKLVVPNVEKIKERLAENKGLIMLTGHFGNWELAAIAFAIHLDSTMNVLVKKQHNPYVTNWLKQIRENYGNREVRLGASLREIFKAIKKNELIGIVGDQRGPRNGLKVNFFDTPTSVFPGTAEIAIKTDCPVFVAFTIRNKDYNYNLIYEEIRINDFMGSKEEKINKFNQIFMSILEKTIRDYPEQWFWMHNIWKY